VRTREAAARADTGVRSARKAVGYVGCDSQVCSAETMVTFVNGAFAAPGETGYRRGRVALGLPLGATGVLRWRSRCIMSDDQAT
jgi:hypothetical protein